MACTFCSADADTHAYASTLCAHVAHASLTGCPQRTIAQASGPIRNCLSYSSTMDAEMVRNHHLNQGIRGRHLQHNAKADRQQKSRRKQKIARKGKKNQTHTSTGT